MIIDMHVHNMYSCYNYIPVCDESPVLHGSSGKVRNSKQVCRSRWTFKKVKLIVCTLLGEGVGDGKVGLVEFEDLGSLLEGVVSVVQNFTVGTYTDLIMC